MIGDTSSWEITLGPPGTGKTTNLIETLREELDRGTPPDRMALVTFTRAAADEARDRVREAFGLSRADLPHFRTLHSMAKRYSSIGDGVLEGDKMSEFAAWIGERITGRVAVDGVWSGYERGDRMLFMDNLARVRRIPLRQLYEEDHDDLDWADVERFSRGLASYKQVHGLYDFTDMLEQMIARGGRPRLEVLLGDEVQDFSKLQWEAFAYLARGVRRVGVAGDDDQSIFEWSGADTDTLIDLQGEVKVLDQSYRVPRSVQRVAGEVIGRVGRRREKHWAPRDDEGRVTWIQDIRDADLSGSSTLILARNRDMLRAVERDVRGAGMLYSMEGFPSVRRSLLTAIVTWERLRRGEPQRAEDVVRGPYSLMRIGAGVSRGYKKLPGFAPDYLVSLAELRARGGLLRDDVWHVALDGLSPEERTYLMACRRRGERLTQPPRVRLSTIHGAKGGEADRVVLMTDMAPRTWREAHKDPDAETRVLYVALTRAREELQIVRPRTERSYRL